MLCLGLFDKACYIEALTVNESHQDLKASFYSHCRKCSIVHEVDKQINFKFSMILILSLNFIIFMLTLF